MTVELVEKPSGCSSWLPALDITEAMPLFSSMGKRIGNRVDVSSMVLTAEAKY